MSRRIRSKTVKHGRNAENPPYPDDQWVHCWNCGFVCNLSREHRAKLGSKEGDGIDTAGEVADVDSGCPLCGCLHYDRRK